jgi:signal transduction histidine kinase
VRGETGTDGGTTLLVRVTDTGPGIDTDDADSIFQRGWSTKPWSTKPTGSGDSADPDASSRPGGEHGPGRGLGLALVRQTVRRHGGTVDVGTGPHGGAEFAVRLPLREDG